VCESGIWLVVLLRLGKPEFTEEPEDVEVSFGSTVYFTCRATGDPAPEIAWMYNK